MFGNSTCGEFLLIVVKTGVDEFEERNVIRNTWVSDAQSLDMTTIFSVGQSTDVTVNKRVLDEAEIFGDILQWNVLESYHNLTLKTYLNLKWIAKFCSGINYVFFTESDVILFPETLLRFLNTHIKSADNILVGHCFFNSTPVRDMTSTSYISTDAWPEPTFPPYCSGSGYIMTADVPGKLLNAMPGGPENWRWALERDRLDDVVFTGLLRQRANVNITHTDRIFHNTQLRYNLCDKFIICIHSFQPPYEFQKMYDLFQNIILTLC